MKTECDHIHILFESSPQVQLSKLVNNFKTVSARLIRKEFKDQVDKYYYKPLFSLSIRSGSILSVTG